MANYDIKFSCGHTETHNIIGRVRDRESKAEWLAQGLCSECWEAEKKRKFDEENKKAAAEAAEYGLPELTGTEKQVAWANTLRQQWITEAEGYIARHEKLSASDRVRPEKKEEAKKMIAGMKAAMDAKLLVESSARFWIDSRDNSASRYLKDAGEKALQEPEIKPVEAPKEIQQQALEDMTMRPSEPITNLVAEIRIKENLVSAKYPEKNEDFRLLLRDLRFDWANNHWERKTNEVSGGSLNRAAELGIKLLAAGFPIRVYSEELQEKILSGEFEPECDRWVLIHGKGFRVWWHRDDSDFYPEAKRLPGSWWVSEKRSMFVPMEAFRDLQGFADRYQFRFTQKAQVRLIEAEQAFEKAMIADIAAPENKTLPQPGSKPEKLEIKESGIDESLKEDDLMGNTNTIDKLIASVKNDSVALRRDTGETEKWCNQLVAANLPDLPDNYEYTYRQKVTNGVIVGEELLSRRVYWSDKMDCWAHDNEKRIMDLPKIPESHVEKTTL